MSSVIMILNHGPYSLDQVDINEVVGSPNHERWLKYKLGKNLASWNIVNRNLIYLRFRNIYVDFHAFNLKLVSHQELLGSWVLFLSFV